MGYDDDLSDDDDTYASDDLDDAGGAPSGSFPDHDALRAAIDAQVQQWADPATPPPGIAPEPDPGDGSHPFDPMLTQAVGAPTRLSDLVAGMANPAAPSSNPQGDGQDANASSDEGGLDFHFGKLANFSGGDPNGQKIGLAYNSQGAPGLPHVMSDLYPGLFPPPYLPFPSTPAVPLPVTGAAWGNSTPQQIANPFSIVPPAASSSPVWAGGNQRDDAATARGMLPRIAQIESGGRDTNDDGSLKINRSGAVGEYQMKPGTAQGAAKWKGVGWDSEKFYDPSEAGRQYREQLAAAELEHNLRQFDGDTFLAAGAYNAGRTGLQNFIGSIGDPRSGKISQSDFSARIPKNSETGGYLRKWLNQRP